MNNNSSTPVVILAFANDQDAYLQMIVKERKAIAKALQDHDDRRYIKVIKEENTSIQDVFDLCTRYSDRVAILHYGGHASGTQLQLEAATGAAEMANATGLAQLLGQQRGLQLVFLNGCATREQVQTLFACGVRAVIATAVPINDEIAATFSEQFYKALAAGDTIQRAFVSAKALVATAGGAAREVGEFRAYSGALKPEAGGATAMPWGLYVNTEAAGDDALGWTLPRVAEHQVIIRGAAAAAGDAPEVNTKLIAVLFNAVAQHNPTVGKILEATQGSDWLDQRMVRSLVADSFPLPVGLQLQRLFNDNTRGVDRLKQLVLTYEMTAELFCFAALSQLWNAKHDTPTISVSAADAAAIDGFLGLTKADQATYDYVALITAVATVLRENAIAPFVDEFAALGELLRSETFDTARRFMEEMRAELTGRVAAEEIESFCVQAEAHLVTILSNLAFLARYQLASIKHINVIKPRHKPHTYRIKLVKQERVSVKVSEEDKDYAEFPDDQAVILMKRGGGVAHYLNLSPFVIDENALRNQALSKLFFYSHRGGDDRRSYVFRFVSNENDELIVSDDDEDFRPVAQQFQDFAHAVRPA